MFFLPFQGVRGGDGKRPYFPLFFFTHTTMNIRSILIWLMTCWQGDDFGQEVAGAVLSKSRHRGHLIPLHLATSSFEFYFFKFVCLYLLPPGFTHLIHPTLSTGVLYQSEIIFSFIFQTIVCLSLSCDIPWVHTRNTLKWIFVSVD